MKYKLSKTDITILKYILYVAEKSKAKVVHFCFRKGIKQYYITPKRDLLVSFDCMEHIPKEEVLDSFKEFARICNRMFIKVALTENTTFIDGEILHTCVESTKWWLNQAENYFNIKSKEVKTPNPAHSHVLIYGESK